MGNSNTAALADDELAEIEVETGFEKKQIKRLYKRFYQLDRNHKGYLEREDFLRIHELAINPLSDRLIDAFFTESVRCLNQDSYDVDRIDNSAITFRQFVRVLACFRPLSTESDVSNEINSRLRKLRFVFSMFDLQKSNYVTREGFKYILNTMFSTNISKKQLDNIVDRILIEVDVGKNGCISFEEFCKAMDHVDVEHKMSIRFIS